MARTAIWVKRVALTASALTLIGLAACDRQQERLDRAGALGDAVLGQLGGEDVTQSDSARYAAVPIEARAFAASVPEQVDTGAERPRFVIGSIVAKPAALPPSIELSEVMAEPEMALDVVVDDQAEAKIIVPDQETLDRGR